MQQHTVYECKQVIYFGGIILNKILAIDVGNSKVKMLGNNGMSRLEIPNVIAEATESRAVSEMEKTIMDSLHIKITEAEFGTAYFTVGNLAAKDAFARELNLVSEKSNNKQSLVMLLTAAALDAIEDINLLNAHTGLFEAKYILSIGLPISQNGIKAKSELTALLRKKYYVEFLNTKDIAGKKVELEFTNVQINTEALAGYATLLTKQPSLSKTNIMLYDLGGLTNDVTVIANNQVNNAFSNSYKEGMAVVLDNIKHKLALNYNYRLNSRQQVNELLLKGKESWQITTFGERIDIASEIEFELMQYAQKILQQVQSLWYQVPQVECCYFMGGGSIILKEYLIKSIQTLGMKLNLQFIDDDTAVWANVEGYAIIANKIFAKQTEVENTWVLS